MALGWLEKSFIAMACFVPYLFLVPYQIRHYSVRPEVTMLWYFAGVLLVVPLTLWRLGTLTARDLVPTYPHLASLFVGATCGAAVNILMSQAIAEAPNPGLPVVLVNAAAVIAFLVAVWLGMYLPKHFEPRVFSVQHLVGIVLVIAGLACIGLKR